MRKILIFGATSAIAGAMARLLAARGNTLFLAARNEAALETLVTDLKTRGAVAVAGGRFEALDLAAHATLIDEAADALGGLDTVILAYGDLPDQAITENSPDKVVAALHTNFVSAAHLLTLVAERFERQGRGTIVGISSVAGDRGRAANYIYGSAKAGLTCLLEGMRQRLARKGVKVVTIKPGLVDTPMTRGFSKGVLWSQPEKVAQVAVRALEAGAGEVYAPGYWRLIMWVIRNIPDRLFARMRF